MRLAGHVALMGDRELHPAFWWGELKEGNNLENLVVDRRIILKCIFKK
jgi:hypothetical protein